MMRGLKREDLLFLLEEHEGPHVSIYMPLHAGDAARQDAIRLKNLLRDAERQLHALGVPEGERHALLEPARALLAPGALPQAAEGGLALFGGGGKLQHHELRLRVDERVVVGQRHHITPLLPLISDEARFYVLALSQNGIRLLRCDADAAEALPLADVPLSLDEAVRPARDEKQLQFHTGTQRARGDRAAMYHGHGAASDQVKERLLRFFQQVDRGVCQALDGERGPLVLAAVEYLHPIYAEVNRCAELTETGIYGNPDEATDDELHQQGWELMRSRLEHERAAALARYDELAAKGRGLSELGPILAAAHDGRIDTLFVARGAQRWGDFDAQARELQLYDEARPGADDVVDLAAARTLRSGGTVYPVSREALPGGGPLVALLRY